MLKKLLMLLLLHLPLEEFCVLLEPVDTGLQQLSHVVLCVILTSVPSLAGF